MGNDQNTRHIKNGLIALGVIVVVGSVGSLLQKHWDTLPAPPQSHEIQLTQSQAMDLDRLSALLLKTDFDKMKSQDKMPIANVIFYASDASMDDVATFYRKAMDTPWMVAKDQDAKGRRIIIFKKLITGELRIIAIESRMMRDAQNHVAAGPGSIVGTAEINDR